MSLETRAQVCSVEKGKERNFALDEQRGGLRASMGRAGWLRVTRRDAWGAKWWSARGLRAAVSLKALAGVRFAAFTTRQSLTRQMRASVALALVMAGALMTLTACSGSAHVSETDIIGGMVSGLTGSGLVIEDNGGNNLAITGNGPFAFTTAVDNGSAYRVTVATQPTNPAQMCTVANGSGTTRANVTNVTVTCVSTASFTIGGTVSGLAGTGLVLADNGGDNLTITANGVFTFKTAITSGNAFKVTVATEPANPAQSCVVSDGTGSAAENVTNVTVVCTTAQTTFTIGGAVSGLNGTGLVLQDNSGNNLPVAANGAFTFTTPVNGGAAYKVTVFSQPVGPAQTCTVTNGSGTASANVTNVAVACANVTTTYTIGGTVSGLNGTGLVLQDNSANNLSITANGIFTFTTAINSGSAYKVTVLTQPTSPVQNCLVTNGSGTASANVTTVTVVCNTVTYTIGGTVSGLSGTGLVLQDNNANNLPVAANGTFTFTTALNSGAAYKVTVLTQPASPAQTCAVTNGSGTAAANVTNVGVTCTTVTQTYTIGGMVSGLTGSGLVLQDNSANNLAVSANGSFAFTTKINSGSAYAVTVLTQPSNPAETCTVMNGGGTATANVSNVDVTCAAASSGNFTVSVTVIGLVPNTHFVAKDNGGDNLTVSANGTATFATSLANGSDYLVTIPTQPIGRTCVLGANAGGKIAGANVVVNVNCGHQIASGKRHTCAVTNTESLYCWGSNSNGQLGNGTQTKSLTPVQVLNPAGTAPLTGIVAVSAGQDFTCALTNTGTVLCWGFNSQEEIGNATTTDSNLPVQVPGLTSVATISSGQFHTCAVTTAGGAMCWGDNGEGELGITGANPGTPAQVTGLTSGVADITGGSFYTCAVLTDSNAKCWGGGGSGQLGAGTTMTGSFTPISVLDQAGTAPLTGVTEISAGFQDTCSIMTDQSALCWGANQDGAQGNGTNTEIFLPEPLMSVGGTTPLANVFEMGMGANFTCAMTATAIQCSGTDGLGQLGDGAFSSKETPQAVSGLSAPPIELIAGFDQAFVVLPSGGVQGWGNDDNGQLGNNSTNNSDVPVTVEGVGASGQLAIF